MHSYFVLLETMVSSPTEMIDDDTHTFKYFDIINGTYWFRSVVCKIYGWKVKLLRRWKDFSGRIHQQVHFITSSSFLSIAVVQHNGSPAIHESRQFPSLYVTLKPTTFAFWSDMWNWSFEIIQVMTFLDRRKRSEHTMTVVLTLVSLNS